MFLQTKHFRSHTGLSTKNTKFQVKCQIYIVQYACQVQKSSKFQLCSLKTVLKEETKF